MNRKRISATLLVVGSLLMMVTPARAQQRVCHGPWVNLQAGAEWGPESHCSCGAVRGGVLTSNRSFAWLWSQGTGQVKLLLEFSKVGVNDQGKSDEFFLFVYPIRRDRSPYVAVNGNGVTEAMHLPSWVDPAFTWTGRYKSECWVTN